MALSTQTWKGLTYCSIFLGWGLYMMCRRLLSSSMQGLLESGVFTKHTVGMVASSFSLSYGVSKLLFSFVSDHVSPRLVFVSGLLCTGVCCLLFPVSSGVILLACVVWGVAGVVQGCGWAPCVVLLKSWFTPGQIGTWWSVLSAAGNIASMLSPLLVLYISSMGDWRLSYYIIGVVTLALSLVMVCCIKDCPEEVGTTTSRATKDDVERKPKDNWYSVFVIFDLWIVGLLYAGLSLVKDGVAWWMSVYLVEVGGRSVTLAAACVGVFQAGGMTGNLLTGYLSDLLLVKNARLCPRAPLLVFFSLGIIGAVHMYRTLAGEEMPELLWSAIIFSVGFLADGMMSVIGLSGMEVAPAHMASSAHGFVCAFAQVGSVLAGWPFASIVSGYGWSTAHSVVELTSVLMLAGSAYLLTSMIRSTQTLKKD